MDRVQEIWQRIKNAAEDGIAEWGSIIIILLLGVASFGLGRLSALEETQPVVTVREAPSIVAVRGMNFGGLIVASRNGSAYYYPWCAGAAKISTGNQLWFPSEKVARAAGFAAAKNCKGLQ